MTVEESAELKRVIERATETAKEINAPVAVVDHLYCELDRDRFQYAPVAGVNTLFRPHFYALIGIAHPEGFMYAGNLLNMITQANIPEFLFS